VVKGIETDAPNTPLLLDADICMAKKPYLVPLGVSGCFHFADQRIIMSSIMHEGIYRTAMPFERVDYRIIRANLAFQEEACGWSCPHQTGHPSNLANDLLYSLGDFIFSPLWG